VRNPLDRLLAVMGWLARFLPHWLVEAVRPAKVPLPWGQMLRSVIAVWAPLAAGIIEGHPSVALLPTMGGIMSVMIDKGGPYPGRFRLVGTAACGGAVGLVIGMFIHGRGWIAVAVLVAVAALSAIISRLGVIGSATGLQLLLYCTLSLGPIGMLRPWWHPALGFVAGAAWALLLLVPGWLRAPRATESELVAAVYHEVANGLVTIGTPELPAARMALIDSVNAAYDALPSKPSSRGWMRDMREANHLLVVLNASHAVTEAVTALRVQGERPPSGVTDAIDRLADAIGPRPVRRQLPPVPAQWSDSPGTLALHEALVRLSHAIAGEGSLPRAATDRPTLPQRFRDWLGNLGDELTGGWLAWTFTIRLTSCMLVASVVSEVLPLQRSYWVPLTVAVILKPDYGSVFIRAVQRSIGTIVGALVGAAILAVFPFGPWLLVPFGILAALLPWGKAANFGLSATFLAPFVVLLIDLLKHSGWSLAADRALDTVVATVVVLLVGYAPWPGSWHAHLPGKFAETLKLICDYMDESLVAPSTAGGQLAGTQPMGLAPWRSRLRRHCYRALSDLRVEYLRTLSEPPAVSRRASPLWPAVAGLEGLLDAVAGTAVTISRGAPAPDPAAVHQLTGELRGIAGSLAKRQSFPPPRRPLPSDQTLEPVTSATRSLLSILTPVEKMPPELWPESA
jgi:uncharacterized membrane protein YccC